ncbi:MAG: glycosyltransferase family 9 protein [Gallintestinimicrobium sp.]|uniref:glycosyltransferase family 9 protein n=1 Tax=Gallintestinimicrobium sp. TaxID=2981655 RepID=UPI003992F506
MKKNSTIYIYLKQFVKGSKVLLCIYESVLKAIGMVCGRSIAKKQLCKDDNVHYFIKNKHLGDAVRTIPAISIFKHYQNAEGTKAKIVVLTRKNLVGLLRCCKEIDEIRMFSEKELERLQWYARNKNNAYHIHPDASTVEEELALYAIPESFCKDNQKMLEIPNSLSTESMEYAQKYIEDNSLDINKTIILAPFAGSSSSVDINHLSQLADYYIKRKYAVLTNAAPEQAVVPLTNRIFLLPDQLLGLVAHGAIVVGVQSGFMDICEWMNLSHKLIKIFVLKNSLDYSYYSKRVDSENGRIQKFGNGIVISVSNNAEEDRLSTDLIALVDQLVAE